MLQRIRIRDFRSLTDLTLPLDNLNILVGKNDTGKSNILRALNLFFNGETDFRKKFDFSIDFSKNSRLRQGKAPEIRIDLQIDLPEGYQAPDSARAIEWTKRWRRDAAISDPPKFLLSGNKIGLIGKRSNIHSYLNSIDYHYIPALKGKDFFQELLAEIYDVLSQVSEDQLRVASQPLQNTLEEILGEVAIEVTSLLKGPSQPKLPENLRSVFRLVQFEANGIDLDRRGDGIRVRHVPSLVKFLCDLKSKRAGRYKSFHLWGLEEPENSVDFIAAFEMRDQILGISRNKQHQIMMATHSPIFFSLENEKSVRSNFFVQTDAETRLAEGAGDVSDEMGVLRVVSPYVEKSREEVTQIKSTLDILTERLEKDVVDPSRRIIFVEGETDVGVLNAANEYLRIIKEARFVASLAGSGSSANAVADNAIAWHFLQKNRHPNRRVRGVGLVDGDSAGDGAIERFRARMEGEDNFHSTIIRIRPPKEIAKLYKSSGFIPRMSLESLFPPGLWLYAKEQKWLEKRSNVDVFEKCDPSKKIQLLADGISSLVEANETLPVLYDVKIGNKREFSDSFIKRAGDDPILFTPFRDTLLELRAKLNDLM